MADVDRSALEKLVRQVLLEKLGGTPAAERPAAHGVRCVAVPRLEVREQDRLDTGRSGDRVWTRDLFSLEEAPRLGCGLMVMEKTTFPWKLTYDEMDYVIDGRLDILVGGRDSLRRAGGGPPYPQGQRDPVLRQGKGALSLFCLSGGLAEMKTQGREHARAPVSL